MRFMGETLTSLFGFFFIRYNYLRPWLSSNRLKLQWKATKTNYPDFFFNFSNKYERKTINLSK